MSMNLNIEVDGKELSLYQTPTHITYMCLMNNDGTVQPEVRGVKALRALYLYLYWVDSLSNGKYDSAEEAIEYRQHIVDHINKIRNAGANAKKIIAYYT